MSKTTLHKIMKDMGLDDDFLEESENKQSNDYCNPYIPLFRNHLIENELDNHETQRKIHRFVTR